MSLITAAVIVVATSAPNVDATAVRTGSEPIRARAVAARFDRIAQVVRGWRVRPLLASASSCVVPASVVSTRVGRAGEFAYTSASSTPALLDAAVVLHSSARLAERVISQARLPATLECVKAAVVAAWQRLHYRVVVRTTVGAPPWLVGALAPFPRFTAYSMHWLVRGVPAISLHLLVQDVRDPRIVDSLTLTQYHQISQNLVRRLLKAAR